MDKNQYIIINKHEMCYVCNKLIDKNKAIYIGQDKWRHIMCEPGSQKWINSEVSKNSKIKKYL